MSNTPETDAVAEKLNFKVDLDFARKLERERGEANTKLQEVSSKLAEALRERNEARADLAAEIKHHWDTTIKIACKLELEHNELREQNAKLRDIAERAIIPLECDGVPWGAKLRAELDQLEEEVK
jgi:hypothetical protein